MTNFFYFLTTGPCVSLFWAIYTKIKICAICLLTFGPTCAIIFGPQRGLVGYDVCAPHGHIFNNCPVCITGQEFVILHKIFCLSVVDTFSTTVPCVSLGRSLPRVFFVILHKNICPSNKNNNSTTVPCVSRGTPSEFVILHKFFCLSSKDKYLTTVPCVSRSTPCEGSMGRFYKRASRLLYHRVGDLSIGNLHKIFFYLLYFFSVLKCPHQANTLVC